MQALDRREVRVGVAVFVLHGSKFLMGKRRNAHGDGTWSLPGGHLEFGESFEQTARREVKEETGLSIGNIQFGAVTNDHFESDGKHYVTIWMLSDYVGGTATTMEPDKFVDIGWFDLDNLPTPLFHPWKQLLASPFIETIRRHWH